MNIRKKIAIFGMGTLLLCGSIISVNATYVVSGNGYQTVTHRNIPGRGRESYDTYYGSKKVTNGTFATFRKTHGDAWLGNFGKIINTSKRPMSTLVGLPLNKPNLATEKGCSKGVTYFSAVGSSGVEPSNTCDVIMEFSADNLK